MRAALLALMLSGCTPAFIGYHTSDPFSDASDGDTAVDMIGAGVCIEKAVEVCAFAGPRKVRTPYAHETGAGVQVIAIYKVSRK